VTGAKTIGNRQLAARTRDLATQAVIRVYPSPSQSASI
jgi:hypothetical protein